MERLESRTLLSVTTVFNTHSGELSLISDSDGDDMQVSQVSGIVRVYVNGSADTTLGTVHASDVKSILVEGGSGDDTIDLSAIAQGGASPFTSLVNGNIEVDGGSGADVITGSEFADSLFGNDGDDQLIGGLENDTLDGEDGEDTISAGAGDDIIIGEDGADLIMGGDGNDVIDSGNGGDTVDGGTGDDSIFGDDGNDSLDGGAGDDTINGDLSNDTITGSAGDDVIFGGGDEDSLVGGAGIDSLHGQGGDDIISGGTEDDWIDAGTGNDSAMGNEGDDFINGFDGEDTLIGNAGNDQLFGGADGDLLFGDHDDPLSRGLGDDFVKGQGGPDSIFGGGGNDTLLGGAADDVVHSGMPPMTSSTSDVASEATTPTPVDDALDIALTYLRENADDFGLVADDFDNYFVTDEYVSRHTGVTHIFLQQQHQDLPIASTTAGIHVDPEGSVISVSTNFLSGLSVSQQSAVEPDRPAADALKDLAAHHEWEIDDEVEVLEYDPDSPEKYTLLDDSSVSLEPVPAELQWVNTENGLELAWLLNVQTVDLEHWYDVSVSASDGAVIEEIDWVNHATYNVFPLPVESPSHGPRNLEVDPHDATASPFEWHDTDGTPGAEFTTTQGNNVHAYTDRDGDNAPDPGSSPDGGAGLVFNQPIDFTMEPDTYAPAAVTNLFYWNNIIHDIHYQYGFDEASGNFQQNNYGLGGLGGDYVLAEAQDGADVGNRNNANMATPPDGFNPRMQMFLWNTASPELDGDFDNGIIIHEYGHGVSNRLTGGPGNSGALNALQSRGMGEGWSDIHALHLTQLATQMPNDAIGIGTYALNQPITGPGIRNFPYSYDMAVNPQTYADIATTNWPHGVGEIWAASLWDMTWLLIEGDNLEPTLPIIPQGFDPDFYTGTGGNNVAMQLIMDGMKLQPANPSMIEGRDAILAADVALTGGANECAIWSAFARRGIGDSAAGGSGTLNVAEAFDIPATACAPFGFDGDGDLITGDGGNDTLVGADGDDTMDGGAGRDSIDGGPGNDVITGGAGLDTTIGGEGDDIINWSMGDGNESPDGGEGYDEVAIHGNDLDNTFTATAGSPLNVSDGTQTVTVIDAQRVDINGGGGDDTMTVGDLSSVDGLLLFLNGDAGDDVLNGAGMNTGSVRLSAVGGAGNDVLTGAEGDDLLVGSEGDDLINGGAGRDTIFGHLSTDFTASDNDTLLGGEGDDRIDGGIGQDVIFGGDQGVNNFTTNDADTLDGGAGDDFVSGEGDDDVILGDVGNDTLRGNGGNDTLNGGDDDDDLNGGEGDDELDGGRDDDFLNGLNGDDQLFGNDGDDQLFGGSGADTLEGGADDDYLGGNAGDDVLRGGDGNDKIKGGAGDDRMNGGDGDDWMDGGVGNDGLAGHDGHDTLNGHDGRDTLLGGDGHDFLFGGAGQDIALGEDGNDYVNGQGGSRDTVAGGQQPDDTVVGAAHEIDELFTFPTPWWAIP